MSIQKRIEDLLEEQKDKKSQNLWNACQGIVENINQHNKMILSQMSNYDIHDQEHSEKVLEIMQNILGEKIEGLSFYELLLLYMSAYLHDSAMAMPEWEYNLLRAVEGTNEFYDTTLAFRICNDYQPVHQFSEALEIVTKNKEHLFNYQKAKDYVCARGSEEDIINSLADLICQYEEFRNGYIDDLSESKTSVSEYINMSKMIRSEFIRQTHHTRVVDNVFALKGKISREIGEIYSQYFLEDLANVCRCHGENLESIFELEVQRKDWKDEISNIQFTAMLLRLGDVIHFSSDRAPLSLFAEKQITDETSYMHWKAKFQELGFAFDHVNGITKVKYRAYCRSPEIYYFIQDYLDWVDNEIENYYVLKNRWETGRIAAFEKYHLPLDIKLDRNEIKYDENVFVPEQGMKFILNQAKILELLMGVQLYKDKFLCIRELYQNALDASKCMLAYNKKHGISEMLSIEFGVGEENIQGRKQKYIYCLDHGTGMNSYIISNYLLHIGNSYYKSKDFAKKNTNWEYDVKPTSQFGIGILSGYMLADKIGITTVHYEGSNKALSFVLEGVSEHFYYVKANRVDEERIGNHGTLVKLYLKPEYEEPINAKYIGKLPIVFMTYRGKIRDKICESNTLENNLFYIISEHIGIPHADIAVRIKDEEGIKRTVYQSNTIFDYRNYEEIGIQGAEMMQDDYYFTNSEVNPYKDFMKNREWIDDYLIQVSDENLEIYSHISLPRKGIGSYNLQLFNFCQFLGRTEGCFFVDGVEVNVSSGPERTLGDILGYDVVKSSLFNYRGIKRPVLSVDRNSCVKMPDMEEELADLRDLFVDKLKEIVSEHIRKEMIETEDPELTMIFNLTFGVFPSLAGKLLDSLGYREFADIKLAETAVGKKAWTIKDVLGNADIELENVDFRQYKEAIRQILLGRSINADKICVDDFDLHIMGGMYTEFPYPRNRFRSARVSLSSMIVKADEWNGIYQEYDLVNRLWPVVNPCLFDVYNLDDKIIELSQRCKTVKAYSCSISEIAMLDPAMIHPLYGIGTREGALLYEKECYVGEFGYIQKGYPLFELTNDGEIIREKKVSPVLFVYIAPRELNAKEQERLREFEEKDPEYVRGVREGWSILFLAAIREYIICPGIVTRKEIIEKIPGDFKNRRSELKYLFTDGSSVFE